MVAEVFRSEWDALKGKGAFLAKVNVSFEENHSGSSFILSYVKWRNSRLHNCMLC